MNPSADGHPDAEQLAALGLGRLSADESGWIEEHLDHCEQCNATLVDLADDTFTEVVRSLARTPVARTMRERCGAATETSEFPSELRAHPRYHFGELIGRGGMGDVYRAEHSLMNRPVAIKLINARLISHPQTIERFRREVRTAAQLHHPNIVTAHDAEQAGSLHFLAMEFVDGKDLASAVKDNGPLPVLTACDYICQAALGLQHAHEKGMVHRDIKPHNLMVTRHGVVKILDFGLASFATHAVVAGDEDPGNNPNGQAQDVDARESSHLQKPVPRQGESAAQLTNSGSVMGTPEYIAPEQARDAHSADIRADIYSLGCTLYFLLTGGPPVEAGGAIDALNGRDATTAPPLLSDLPGDIPSGLQRVLDRMLARNPQDRFQSPSDVVEALRVFMDLRAERSKTGSWWTSRALTMVPLVLFAGLMIRMATDTALNGPDPVPPPPRAGLLTNPPTLPSGGLPVGTNLINDPSLEDTPAGTLPAGWFAWLDDGPDFNCEVVQGGVTGKQCLQISGTGTRGVVFATSIPLDRTKRYALKGRVKVEGEAGTWAVVKLNYFNNSGWLGVDDRIGVTTSDADWMLFKKTDIAERYATATLIVPTCHLEGNATAWFDDLEVIAFDRAELPDDFDAKNGRNNR